jgi:hypothetical protein
MNMALNNEFHAILVKVGRINIDLKIQREFIQIEISSHCRQIVGHI